MTDRTKVPDTFAFAAPDLLPMQCIRLSNGIPVYMLQHPDYKLIRMDVRLKAGSRFQPFPGVAQTTAKILLEGTVSHPDNWSECMDGAGVFVELSVERDFVSFSFHFPQEKASTVLPLAMEIFREAHFAPDKLDLLRMQHRQQLAVQLEKGSFVAYRQFLSTLFGTHPYGQSLALSDMDRWNPELLRRFFEDCYVPEATRIFIAGHVTEEVQASLQQTFGQWKPRPFRALEPEMVTRSKPAVRTLVREQGVQSSLCMGKIAVTRTHDDWMGLQLLNRLLGGYFGSRLMTEIRERSGLAYGIHSHLISCRHAGIWCISADVNASRAAEAVEKIKGELRRLIETPVDEAELSMVKNYEFGSLLRGFDGLFLVLERYMEADDASLPIDCWKNYFDAIPAMTAGKLQQLADKYLQPESMSLVVVGPELSPEM